MNYISMFYSLVSKNIDWSDTSGSTGQFFLMIVVFVGVVVMAYFTTKFIASGKIGRKGNNLEIVESIGLNVQSSICIVRAGSGYYLVGITKDRINYMTELDYESLTFNEEKAISVSAWEKSLSKIMKNKK